MGTCSGFGARSGCCAATNNNRNRIFMASAAGGAAATYTRHETDSRMVGLVTGCRKFLSGIATSDVAASPALNCNGIMISNRRFCGGVASGRTCTCLYRAIGGNKCAAAAGSCLMGGNVGFGRRRFSTLIYFTCGMNDNIFCGSSRLRSILLGANSDNAVGTNTSNAIANSSMGLEENTKAGCSIIAHVGCKAGLGFISNGHCGAG